MKEIHADSIAHEVAQACIRASWDLPADVEACIREAAGAEESPLGQWALSKICSNIDIARDGRVPLCQDTGLVVVFAEVGQDVRIVGGAFEDAVNAGVARGYTQGYLRTSLVADPLLARTNTNDNTPATIHTRLVEGDGLELTIMPKGGGSENMSRLGMLKPAQGVEGVVDFVVNAVVEAGGNPCPPTIVGVGIGGNAEGALLLSKQALRRELGVPNPNPGYAQLEARMLAAINDSGVGPQGFGGRITALAVHIETAPTHIASLPVGITLNCHAARHVHIRL